jgi:cytochrome c oxidase subunit 1/cytochrome c oxidase subunit I+III
VATAINIIATVLSLRAKGMTLRRLPLFTWINFVNAFIVLAALPVLNAGLVMLLIDRQLDAHFFVPTGGGSAIMWQHIFWAFGHPEVYILALPAFAILSEIIPVFSRKPIFGYEFVAGSSVVIAILSLGVWAHHMFTTGLGRPADLFFGIASMLIAIPTGVKVLNWTATMVGGRLRFDTPMLFCIAAIVQFVPAGLTGVSHAMPALDWQTKNSYYLVAHFHFVAVGLIVFALLGAIQYWFPKMSGRMLSERLGKWSFWLMVIGFNMTFIIQHFLGLLGMPRRVYTYPDLPHYTWMNLLSSAGAIFMTAAALILVCNIVVSLFWGRKSTNNPWNAWTLEWATNSPPPPENFHELPPILSHRPLWDLANPDRPDPVIGQPHDLVARPDRNKVNVLAFIFSEIGFFGILILAYLYYNAQRPAGPGAEELNLSKTLVFSACLFASSFTIWRSEVALRGQKYNGMIAWLILTIILGTIFIIGQGIEYWDLFEKGVRLSTNLFGSSFFTLTGFHGLHVCFGLIAMLLLLGMALAGDFRKPSQATVLEAVGYYWHFVDGVWVVVLSVVYLLPLLSR